MKIKEMQLREMMTPRIREARGRRRNRRAMWRICGMVWLITGMILGYCYSRRARHQVATPVAQPEITEEEAWKRFDKENKPVPLAWAYRLRGEEKKLSNQPNQNQTTNGGNK